MTSGSVHATAGRRPALFMLPKGVRRLWLPVTHWWRLCFAGSRLLERAQQSGCCWDSDHVAGVLPAAPRLPPYAARPPQTNVHERLIGSDTIVSAGVVPSSRLLVLTPEQVFCPSGFEGGQREGGRSVKPIRLYFRTSATMLGWNVSVSDCSRCSWTSKLEVVCDVTHQGDKIKAFVPTFLPLLRLFLCVGGASPVSWLES